jgi:hypothetical protein
MRRLRLEQSQILPKPQAPPNPQGGPGLPLDQANAAYTASSDQIAASRETIRRLEQALAAEQSKMKCGDIVDKVAETGLSSLDRMSTSGAGALDSMSARLSEAIAGLKNPPKVDLESLKLELRQISELERQSAERTHQSDQTENRTLRERIEQLLQQNGTLTSDVTRLTQELIDLRRAFEDAMRQTQEEHGTLIRTLEERIRELMRENAELQRFRQRFGGEEDGPSHAELMAQLQALQAENDQLRAYIADLQAQLGQGGNPDLARQLQEAREQQARAEADLVEQVGQKNARIEILEAYLRRAGQDPDQEGQPPPPGGDAQLRARIAELEAQAAGEPGRIEAAKQQAVEAFKVQQKRAQTNVAYNADGLNLDVVISENGTQGPWFVVIPFSSGQSYAEIIQPGRTRFSIPLLEGDAGNAATFSLN